MVITGEEDMCHTPPTMYFRQDFGTGEGFTHPKVSFGGVELNTNML